MSETLDLLSNEIAVPELTPDIEDAVRARLEASLDGSHLDRETQSILEQYDGWDASILAMYATILKNRSDYVTEGTGRKPTYAGEVRLLADLQARSIRTLYESDEHGPFREMIDQTFVDSEESCLAAVGILSSLKKAYELDRVLDALVMMKDNSSSVILIDNMSHSATGWNTLSMREGEGFAQRGDKRRLWMRDALMLATGIEDEDEADNYSFSLSKSLFGEYELHTMITTINNLGKDRLHAINEFSGIHAIGAYNTEQLERMEKLAEHNEQEIDYLRRHDVVVAFINREGDHNGISFDIAERIDDEAKRTLFFEITDPAQIYQSMKQLNDMGILPTTLIFASHGGAGQYAISEKPKIGEAEGLSHFTTIHDQAFLDTRETNFLKGYSIDTANGLIRAVQKFMQPSRGIDDPDQDMGRKKIISLSCEFDAEAQQAQLDTNGEAIGGEKTTLLRKFGEAIMKKLPNEHIDIYGADISTNSSTRTDKGLHYNTLRQGRYSPYAASVLHIDGSETKWHKLNEIKLRK